MTRGTSTAPDPKVQQSESGAKPQNQETSGELASPPPDNTKSESLMPHSNDGSEPRPQETDGARATPPRVSDSQPVEVGQWEAGSELEPAECTDEVQTPPPQDDTHHTERVESEKRCEPPYRATSGDSASPSAVSDTNFFDGQQSEEGFKPHSPDFHGDCAAPPISTTASYTRIQQNEHISEPQPLATCSDCATAPTVSTTSDLQQLDGGLTSQTLEASGGCVINSKDDDTDTSNIEHLESKSGTEISKSSVSSSQSTARDFQTQQTIPPVNINTNVTGIEQTHDGLEPKIRDKSDGLFSSPRVSEEVATNTEKMKEGEPGSQDASSNCGMSEPRRDRPELERLKATDQKEISQIVSAISDVDLCNNKSEPQSQETSIECCTSQQDSDVLREAIKQAEDKCQDQNQESKNISIILPNIGGSQVSDSYQSEGKTEPQVIETSRTGL